MSRLREVRAEELVGDEPKEQPKLRLTTPPESGGDSAALGVLLLALKAVSQRAFTSLVNSVTLLGLAAVGALAWRISENPSILQLVELSVFACFVLALRYVWRK